MKTLILAALISFIGLASCTVTQPEENNYPQQRAYNSPAYQYDPFYSQIYDRYSIQRVYDYNTGRYYDIAVYNSPAYNNSYYQNRNYGRGDYYRRENNARREYIRDSQPQNEQPNIQKEKRLPDGTTISPDGTITLPNGEVKRKQ